MEEQLLKNFMKRVLKKKYLFSRRILVIFLKYLQFISNIWQSLYISLIEYELARLEEAEIILGSGLIMSRLL